jgi:hypothetical protein
MSGVIFLKGAPPAPNLGLPEHGHNAFTAVPPRGKDLGMCTAPKKRGPKSRTAAEKTIAALRDNVGNNFCMPIATAEKSDRTRAIQGRSL